MNNPGQMPQKQDLAKVHEPSQMFVYKEDGSVQTESIYCG
jgi:hypothetical protein